MLDANRIAQHEEAAHEKRNWIRLTAACNNRCTFCLDSDAHNGTNISPMTVKREWGVARAWLFREIGSPKANSRPAPWKQPVSGGSGGPSAVPED